MSRSRHFGIYARFCFRVRSLWDRDGGQTERRTGKTRNAAYIAETSYNNNKNIRLIRRCQNATCYNDMDRTVKKHEVTEQLDC